MHSSLSGSLADFDHTKKVAIQSMARIYLRAVTTLVFDAELQQFSTQDPHPKLLAGLLGCGWGTRGWTLQEGNLARSCHLALREGSVDIRGLEPRGKEGRHVAIECFDDMCTMLAQESLSIRRMADQPEGVHQWADDIVRVFEPWTRDYFNPIEIIWDSLVQRATSQAEDVPAIMANLAGFDAFEILQIKEPSARVSAMLLATKSLPVGWLFQSGPRLKEFGSSLQLKTEANSLGRFRNRFLQLIRRSRVSRFEHNVDDVEPQALGPTCFWSNRWCPAEVAGSFVSGPTQSLSVYENRLQLDWSPNLGTDLWMFEDQNLPLDHYHLRLGEQPTTKFLVELQQTGDDLATRHKLQQIGRHFCLLLESAKNDSNESSILEGAQFIVCGGIEGQELEKLSLVYDCAVRLSSIEEHLAGQSRQTEEFRIPVGQMVQAALVASIHFGKL